MKISKFVRVTWAMFDSLMVFMIFILTALMIYGSEGSILRFRKICSVPSSPRQARWAGKTGFRSSSQVVRVKPVAYERARASQIARNMVSSSVKKLPSRQSLDMRENDHKYEVRFSLPRDVGEDSLNVEVAGNILTLMMMSNKMKFIRRIRIPCDYAQECSLNHYVSNQVLFVEISKQL